MSIISIAKVKNQQGFSLVELAIVMIIFGLVVSTVFLGYTIFTSSQAKDKTLLAIDETKEALFEFQISRTSYPCPASLEAGPGDPNYGREVRRPPAAPAVIGECDYGLGTGVFRTRGFRDTDGINGNDWILIGAVPFRTFIDPDNNDPSGDNAIYPDYIEKYGFDGWNRKLTYAVSETMTNPNTFNDKNGVIDIIHENTLLGTLDTDPDASLTDRRGIAQLVILSHGPNGKGAYSRGGTRIENCAYSVEKQADIDNGVATTRPDETENCDFNDPYFLSALQNENKNDYYDDIVKFMIVSKNNLWQYSGKDDKGTPADTTDDVNKVTNTNGGNVGIGTLDPLQRLHVEGDIQAYDVYSIEYCDSAGIDCMLPEAIAGKLPNMTCPNPGEVVIKIEKNSVQCANPFAGASLAGTCPPGTYLRGINAQTGIVCD